MSYSPPIGRVDLSLGEIEGWFISDRRPLILGEDGAPREMADAEQVTLADVALSGNPSDLSGEGATEGQVLIWDGEQWSPGELSMIKSIQTGYVASGKTNGTGEDANYADITIAAVDPSRSIAEFRGQAGTSSPANISNAIAIAPAVAGTYGTGLLSAITTCRLLNSTTLRISCSMSMVAFVGRWRVVEYV